MKTKKTKRLLAAFISGVLGASMLSVPSSVSAENGGKGDFNRDGEVTIADAVLLKEYLLGKNISIYNEMFRAGDMNGDGRLNVFDYNILKQKLMEKYGEVKSLELTAKITPYSVRNAEPGRKFASSQADFAVSLLQNVLSEDENTLVAPYSVASALAMVLNGADGETKKEMADVLFGGMSITDINEQLSAYLSGQPKESGCRLMTANSIWTNNDGRFIVSDEFLEKNKSYYNSEIFSAPFDSTGLDDVNLWTRKKTDGMIPELLDELDPEVVMMLVNAVSFEAKWEYSFLTCWQDNMTFNSFDGTAQTCDALIEGMADRYIKDDNAAGFLKKYKGGRYSFAVIMPDEGVSVLDYTKGLSGEKFTELVKNSEEAKVRVVKMPKIETGSGSSIKEDLIDMGIKTSFGGKADLSGMGYMRDGRNVFLNDVIHKTSICVYDKGTKAAAATVAQAIPECVTTGTYNMTVDRPFVYAIVDDQTNIPIFIGTYLKAK